MTKRADGTKKGKPTQVVDAQAFPESMMMSLARSLSDQSPLSPRTKAESMDGVMVAYLAGFDQGKHNRSLSAAEFFAEWIAAGRPASPDTASEASTSVSPDRSSVETKVEITFEVWQEGMLVASSTNEADARHYHAVYSQDMPASLVRNETRRTPMQ